MVFVLVTGASGFVGSHVVDQLLEGGHKVRGIARPSKADRLLAAYSVEKDEGRFEVCTIEDISSSDMTAAFDGIEALMHVASPLPFGQGADVILKGAIEGTTRVLEFAAKAGTVKNVVVTSSVAAVVHPNAIWKEAVLDDQDFSNLTYEDATRPGTEPRMIYPTSKSLSEKAVLEFAKNHPEMEISTVHPAYIYGPTGRGQVLDAPADGTNAAIYSLFKNPPGVRQALPPAKSMYRPSYIHVSAVARAHVLLLAPPTSSPSSKPGEVKRVVLKAKTMHWKDAVEYLAETRPELRDRLLEVPKGWEYPEAWVKFSGKSAERWIGMKDEDYKEWKETLDGTVDDILKREKALGINVTSS